LSPRPRCSLRRHTPRKPGMLRPLDSSTNVSGILDRPPQCAIAYKADDDNRELEQERPYAAYNEPRKPSTSDFSRPDCDDNPLAASSNRAAALRASSVAWLTLTMLLLTARVPSAACCTFPAISRVAVP